MLRHGLRLRPGTGAVRGVDGWRLQIGRSFSDLDPFAFAELTQVAEGHDTGGDAVVVVLVADLDEHLVGTVVGVGACSPHWLLPAQPCASVLSGTTVRRLIRQR